MRKTILLLASTLATAAVYGQGQFTFDNFSGTVNPNLTTIDPIFHNQGNAGDFIGSEYSVSLYWLPGTVSQVVFDASVGNGTANLFFSTPYGLGATVPDGTDNTTGAGYFAYSNPADQSSTVVVPGQTGTITVEAAGWWSADGGYLQALAANDNAGQSQAVSLALATGVQLVPNANEI